MQNMDSAVLDNFTSLANEKDLVRSESGCKLIKYLSQQYTENNQEDNQEWRYALKRLIRGLGSSRVFSRKGYYTTLTILLKIHPDISIEKLMPIIDTELHSVNSNSKSENADIHMGRVLACGAMIRSKLLIKSSIEIQQKVIKCLLTSGKERSYLLFVAVSFLIEFINQFDSDTFEMSVWPLIETEFGKAWSEQTLDTFYVLLVIKDKFPSLIDEQFCKKYLDCQDIISMESMDNIVTVLTDLPRIVSRHHPVFNLFCKQLTSNELIIKFWTGIDKKFVKPSKSDEHLAVEIFKILVTNVTDTAILPSLLSTNFLPHMLRKFCNYRKSNEVLVTFKDSLFLLGSTVKGVDVKTKTQISILKKLIFYPGDLMIEKKTGVKIVQTITANLKSDGVKKLSEIYRGIIDNTIAKQKQSPQTEMWTNVERTYAAQLLSRLTGHPNMILDQEWRLDQLKFLFTYGLCEVKNVGGELAPQFKDSFYRALDHKLPKLNDLRNVLSSLVRHLDVEMKGEDMKLRTPLTDSAQEAWKKMMSLMKKMDKSSKHAEAYPIFHTMILHMGIQLFSDPEMAVMSINELQSCFDRWNKTHKTLKQQHDEREDKEDEPEWVEVVVDLILSLLSRNNHLLRSLVGCVFPHICQFLTPNAVYQIIAVFDVKKNHKLLNTKNGIENGNDSLDTDSDLNSASDQSDDQNDDDSDDEDNDDDDSNNVVNDNDDDDKMDTEDSVDESDSNFDEESEADEELTEKLRSAVREALGDTSVQTDDEDIDVDEIDETEGKRLNDSLAAAFKILKENRKSQSKKQEKSAQALTHFRVRVIDLLDAYLESGPPMAIALDMVVPLFALLEFCIKDPHQKPLENRVRGSLKRLSGVKKFKNTEGVDEKLIETIIKVLIEKGERSAAVCQEMGDKLAECSTFLIRCAQQAGVSDKVLINVYGKNLTDFFKKRDCVLPATLFKSIFQLCWDGNWKLAPLLVDFAFDETIRSFRRSQALEFLTTFYKNGRLVRLDTENEKVKLRMEKKLSTNTINIFEELCAANEDKDDSVSSNGQKAVKEVKQKFVHLLLILLHTVHTQHLPQAWNWEHVAKVLAAYRNQVSLSKDAKSAFNRLAAQIGIPIDASGKKRQSAGSGSNPKGERTQQLEQNETNRPEENGVEEMNQTTERELVKKKKNKRKQKDKQVLKMEAKSLRENAMSEGLQPIGFDALSMSNGVDEPELLQNGDHEEQSVKDDLSKKRSHNNETDIPRKIKKKKNGFPSNTTTL